MKSLLLIALPVAAISAPAYLISAQLVANKLKKSFPEEWDGLGRPSVMQAAHQGSLFGILFGKTQLTSEAKSAVAKALECARVLGIVSFLSVMTLFFYAW